MAKNKVEPKKIKQKSRTRGNRIQRRKGLLKKKRDRFIKAPTYPQVVELEKGVGRDFNEIECAIVDSKRSPESHEHYLENPENVENKYRDCLNEIAYASISVMHPCKNIAKVHFKDKRNGIKGFGIICESGYPVDCYGNNTFGINAEEQLRLLEEHDIQFDRI